MLAYLPGCAVGAAAAVLGIAAILQQAVCQVQQVHPLWACQFLQTHHGSFSVSQVFVILMLQATPQLKPLPDFSM